MKVFYLFLKNTWNWAKKTIFWHILRGFWFTPSYALWVTPQSCAIFSFLWRYIVVVSFITLAFVLSSYKCSNVFMAMQHPWNHPFMGFLSSFPPTYGTSLLKCRPEVVSHKTKTVSKQSFKNKCLSGNMTYPKLKVLVHFWAQFTPGKPKVLPKTRIFPETTSLSQSNNKYQVPDKSQNSYKINFKNPSLGAKLDFLR